MTKKQGLTGFQLKYLALICMVLDHIHYFFDYTGKIPLLFSQVGRIAAPLFLFCIVEGFIYTRNRKRYFLRIYSLAILMGLIHFGFYNFLSPLVRKDGFFPQNMMLSSFAILIVALQGIDWLKQKQYWQGSIAVLLSVGLPFLFAPLYQIAMSSENAALSFSLNLLNFTLFPTWSSIADGGIYTLIVGVSLYLCRRHRIGQLVTFVMLSLLVNLGIPALLGFTFTWQGLIDQLYEWMGVFAVIPMALYNGEKGQGNKSLFYWFYPVHIYLLYAVSVLLYH
ncbi:TraX family protein [Streptococcus merionis]|uniref:TraX family protein n=1 Tax=Streptococcus merionis TaxID=400065 RepID=UPI0035174EFA